MALRIGTDTVVARIGGDVVSRIYQGLTELYAADGAPTTAIASVTAPDPILFTPNPNTIFTRNVAAAPINPNQATYLAEFKKQAALYGNIGSNFHQFTSAFYIVNGSAVPPVTINFWDEQNKQYVPNELYADGGPEIFKDVPLPDDAIPALGTDSALILYDQETDTLWEFWQLRKMTGGFDDWAKGARVPDPNGEWAAVWGSKIENASVSSGVAPEYQSVAATAISYAGTTIGTAEVNGGGIDHVMAIQLVRTHPSLASYPAGLPTGATERRHDFGWQTLDNSSVSTFIPAGLRIRLKASVDVDAIPGMTALGRKIAKAAQVYGFVVTDTAGAVSIVGESGYPTQVLTGTNPWVPILAADGLNPDGAEDFKVMQNFPVDDLEFIAFDWGVDVPDVPDGEPGGGGAYTDTLTESQGGAWSGTHWLTEVQRGAGTFLVDAGSREMTTTGGAFTTALLAVNKGPSWGSFHYTGELRIDTAGEKYVKLGFWSDGIALGAPQSGITNAGLWLAFSNTQVAVEARTNGANTVVGSAIQAFPVNVVATYKVEIEADASTGNVKVWIYTGATRSATPQLDVTAAANIGRRSGVFTVGMENGAVAGQSAAFAPMTVVPL